MKYNLLIESLSIEITILADNHSSYHLYRILRTSDDMFTNTLEEKLKIAHIQ